MLLRMRALHLTCARKLCISSGARTIRSVEIAVAGGEELPSAFQKDCWGDDDECEEEDDSQNASWGSRQREATEAGMIQVGVEGWREEVKRKLSDITGLKWERMDNAIDAVEKAGKATCFVRRGCDSQERIDYHELERMAEAASSEADREKHRRKAENARNNKRGVGTGLLLQPRCPLGYLVITNCHVVMNEEEAKGARILFDYLIDDKEDGMRKFDVAEFLAWSPRTTSSDDGQNLDFCILLVKATTEEDKHCKTTTEEDEHCKTTTEEDEHCKATTEEDEHCKTTTEEDEVFLQNRGIFIEETARIQAANDMLLKMVGLKSLPLIMFSHPRNLALRVSVGKYPKEIGTYPISHICHDLPTLQGSSGANILFSAITDKDFLFWTTAFVHYRHGCAVAWQAIGPQIRDFLSTMES